MIREEVSRLFTLEERHRRLLARLLLALGLSIVVFVAGTVLTWVWPQPVIATLSLNS